MYKILIVEDDKTIAEAIRRHLQTWGLSAVCVEDFRDVTGQFTAYDPQLVLLDISLPFFNGYHVCAELRKLSAVPIVFISSASDNMNIVMAMNMGGDDFIAKPFDMDVLTAKVQALLRRTYSMGAPPDVLQRGGALLSRADATLECDGKKTELTKNEFRILELLFENAGRVVSRDTIMTRLWESDSFIDDNTLTVNMTRLRRKLDEVGCGELVLTKKGLGYMVQ